MTKLQQLTLDSKDIEIEIAKLKVNQQESNDAYIDAINALTQDLKEVKGNILLETKKGLLTDIKYTKEILTFEDKAFQIKPSRVEAINAYFNEGTRWNGTTHVPYIEYRVMISYKPSSTTRQETIKIVCSDEKQQAAVLKKLKKLLLGV